VSRQNETIEEKLTKLALRCLAREAARLERQGGSLIADSSILAIRLGVAMRRKQNADLISHIYELAGNGTLPISAGKFELKKRHKLF
jgi:hypothetical protein